MLLLTVQILLAVSLSASPVQTEASVAPIQMTLPSSDHNYYGILAKRIYTEAFKRLQVPYTLIRCDFIKCAYLVSSGIADGALTNTLDFQLRIPSLIRVKESAITAKIALFSTLQTQPPEDLTTYLADKKIVALSGHFFVINRLKEISLDLDVTPAEHWLHALSLLNAGKVNVYIGAQENTLEKLRNKKWAHIKMVGNFASVPLYTFFNPRHKNLASDLNQVLKKMKQDGTTQKYTQAMTNAANLKQANSVKMQTIEGIR